MSYKLTQDIRAREAARAKEPNQFERHGRAVKVGAMLKVADDVIALMPAGTSDVEAAKRFRRFRQEDRARVALLAGVNVPSDKTWLDFCEAVATRKARADFFDAPEIG